VDPSNIHFVVTDSERSMESKRLLSKIGPYYVWDCRHGPWVLLTAINNPNGLEGVPGAPFIWMGRGDTELQILSGTATSAVISAAFTLGPSLPGKARQRMLVKGDGFDEERVIGNGEQSFTIPLRPGLNRVLLRPLEKPSLFLPNDPRPLLIQVARLSVLTPPDGEITQIREIENPNGLESRFGREPFFWMGGGDTIVTLFASDPGIAQLTTTLLPGPSLVDKSKARLSIISSFGAKIQWDLDWGAAKIDIPVQLGSNKIVMRAIGPHVKTPGDSRTMMIGFRNLQASYVEETARNN
jgi:hypothetical protein